MFDLEGSPVTHLLQREAEIRGEYPVIGRYPHPYKKHTFLLLACGHQVLVEGEGVERSEFRFCNRCPAPRAIKQRPASWSAREEVPSRTVVEVVESGSSKKLKGVLGCGHYVVGYRSRIKVGRIVRCQQCKGGSK